MTDARQLDERRLVEAFAEHGAAKMAKRRHHGRWVGMHYLDVAHLLLDELDELRRAIAEDDHMGAREECIDVAVVAMMLREQIGLEVE